jgi:hypothetical protein
VDTTVGTAASVGESIRWLIHSSHTCVSRTDRQGPSGPIPPSLAEVPNAAGLVPSRGWPARSRSTGAGTSGPRCPLAGRTSAYGVGSAPDQAKMSVFPKFAGHSCSIAGRPSGNTDGSACMSARQDWTGPHTAPARTSFQTATA